jgi:hypothetical protein
MRKVILPVVEHHVPIPSPRKTPPKREAYGSPWRELLQSMKKGDSIRVPSGRLACLKSNAKILGMEITSRSAGKMTDPNDFRGQAASHPNTPYYYKAIRVWCISPAILDKT